MNWKNYINKVNCMDAMDLLKELPDKSIDLVLTDPPYGVNYEYSGYEDTPENLEKLMNNVMPEILRVGKRVLMTTGIMNMFIYPKPKWILSWISTAGVGCNPWGFSCWQPILAYGKDPYLEKGLGSRPDIIMSNKTTEKWIKHSCSKPIDLWRKILLRGSLNETDLILDPFMGSWTTAVACQNLKRNFIGCEIDKDYCEIGRQRLRQKPLF